MSDPAGRYRTNFPTAVPGLRVGKRQPGSGDNSTYVAPVGVALPGMTKAQKLHKSRTKKRTGYAYEPVGPPLRSKKAKKVRSQFADVRGRSSTSLAYDKKVRAAAAKVATAAAKAAAKKPPESKLSKLTRSALGKGAAVVAGAVGRTIFGAAGRAGAKTRAARAAQVTKAGKAFLQSPAGKAVVAGAIAYGVTRASPLGGKAGDAVVAAYYRRKDRSEDAKLKAFRQAVAAERAQGPVTSARVRQLAKQFGFKG